MGIQRRVWLVAAGVAGFWLLAGPAVRGAAVQPADVRKSLQEMAALETKIERLQQWCLEEEHKLLKASRSLQSIQSSLEEKAGLKEEGRRFFESLDERTRQSLEQTDRKIDENRRTLGQAREGLGLAAAALLAESESPPGAPEQLLALALLQDAQRGRALVASERILRLETERAELTGRREHAEDAAQYHSIFAQYSLEQLRQRHDGLARQVAELQTRVDAQSRTMHELAGQHDELKNLIAALVEKEVKETPTPTPAAAPPEIAPPPAPLPLPLPAETPSAPPTPAERAADGNQRNSTTSKPPVMIAEAPYEEGSAPMVSRTTRPASPDRTTSAGTRHLFWRARPVGVRALAGGQVLFSGSFAGYRHLLIIDHGGGWRVLYGNLTSCALKQGELVRPGQIVGQYQATQESRAEPLWFEVRQGTQIVEPGKWPALPTDWEKKLFIQPQNP